MPYKLEWEDKGLLIRFSGSLISTDIVKSNSEFIGNQKTENIQYIISDLTNIKNANINKSDFKVLKDFAVRNHPINPKVKVAIVTSQYDLINLIEEFISNTNTIIQQTKHKHFIHIDDAREWVSS